MSDAAEGRLRQVRREDQHPGVGVRQEIEHVGVEAGAQVEHQVVGGQGVDLGGEPAAEVGAGIAPGPRGSGAARRRSRIAELAGAVERRHRGG